MVRNVEFPILKDGVKIGSVKAPAGKPLPLVSLSKEDVTVTYCQQPNRVPLDATDIRERARQAMEEISRGAKDVEASRLLSTTPASKPEALATPPVPVPKKEAASASRYLRAHGREIQDASGKAIILRGVNIGGWLVTEGWMCGQTDENERRALERMEERFGEEKAATLINAWYDNWFTSEDLDALQGYGFNLIRIPFSWRNLQNAKGEWIRNKRGEIDFSRFDWIVAEAAKRGIYIIFDLHRWPGKYGEISRVTDEGQKIREQMADLWKEFARHFKGNATIAGYDVINEPEGSPGDLPHRAFYDAIRSVDPDRMLIMEWTSVRHWPSYGWENVVVSDHYPESEAKDIPASEVEKRLQAFEEKKLEKTPNYSDYPVFMGEAKAPEDNAESARAMVEAFEKRGWSWAIWTYKGISVGGWASFNYHGSLKYDMTGVSYEELLDLWTDGLSRWRSSSGNKNYYLTNWWIEGYSKH